MIFGMNRSYVMKELCSKLNIHVIEKNIEPYDVYNADEAFMTGTPFCMLPVTKLNNVNIGNGKVGNIYKKILKKWSSNTGVDIEKQIKSWDKKNSIGSNKKSRAPTPYKF